MIICLVIYKKIHPTICKDFFHFDLSSFSATSAVDNKVNEETVKSSITFYKTKPFALKIHIQLLLFLKNVEFFSSVFKVGEGFDFDQITI